ncbi:MAG: beta-ketoacyl-[acyl-carrier-protein] synthase family protein [Deltaproteobacteria bacterium]|nr:MAG: beta-ketoacyl-[acyl-carrier-protein] synthase family protein [Deltaproteobacteria bacterium]
MNSKTAVIAGFDTVSPLGTELSAQWERALEGKSGIGPLTRFPLADDFPVRIAGQVPDFDPAPYPFLSPRAMAHWTSPVFPHALLTVHRALNHSGIEIDSTLAPRVAITFSSAVGGQDAVLAADRRMIAEHKLPHPFTNPNSCINMVGGKVSILTGATGPILSTITACATGLTSIITGAMLIRQGMADVVICGAVDFALVEPIVAGFFTMNGAFNPKPGLKAEPPHRASRPFSVDRRGFVISEGAAAIVLCSHEFSRAHGLDPKIALAGYAMTSDAHHFVAPNLATVSRCIKESLADARIEARQIDAVNAHAASTRVGDRVEYDALAENFPGRIPPVTANKSLIGHAMGASSAIESVFTIMGMINRTLIPTINYTEDPALPIDCVSEGPRRLEQEFVLKNAFGFGGCNSCAVFQKINA